MMDRMTRKNRRLLTSSFLERIMKHPQSEKLDKKRKIGKWKRIEWN